MDPKLRNLAWSELRQRRTQLAVCLLWMVGGTAYCIVYEWSRRFRAPAASFYTTASVYAMFAPIFLAMRTSLGETTDRTRSFSDGLPISARWRGWIRLIGGAATLAVPIAIGAALLSVCLALGWLDQAALRPPDGNNYVGLPGRANLSALSAVGLTWRVAAAVAWSATCLYLIVSLLGTKLRAESHLGYCGAAVSALWELATSLREIFGSHPPQIVAWLGAVVPGAMIINYGYEDQHGSYGDLVISPAVLGPLLVNLVFQLGLAALFVRRYDRQLAGSVAERSEKAARLVWWKPWLPTRRLALAWLAWRQAVPMCLPGLVIVCLMTPFQMGMQNSWELTLWQRYTDSMSSSLWIVGLLWAVVVGAGLFSSEIDWRVGEFWRTRPISAGQLFGVKFIAGLLAVLLVLDGTVVVAGWNSPNWGHYYAMNWPYIACFLPLHSTMFAIAVAWTCLLRRAVLGGMAAIATYALTTITLEWSDVTRGFDPIHVFNESGFRDRSAGNVAYNYPVVAAAMGLILIASILIGWLALRRYDPRRQTG
jgi:ABC-type transport system involved in multi-copper enzyme maturation permease subunit